MDYNEFASKIKTKYPDYADMDNRELAQKMVAKFPQYSDVTFDEPQQPSMLDQAADISSGVQNAVMGPIVSGIASGAKAISRYATGSEKPAEMIGKAVNYLPQKIEQAGETIAERGAQGMTRMGVPQGAAIPIAATAGMMAANAPYFMLPSGGSSKSARGALDAIANEAEKSSSSRWFKGMGGTLPQAKELGSEETLRVGRMARNKGIITPLNGAESQAKNIAKGLSESGKRIEELRGLGDLYGDAPEAMKIVQIIKQDLGPKYASGIRSGEQSELEKAIQEVMKLEPVDKLTPGEEIAGFLKRDIPTEQGSFKATTPETGKPTIQQPNPMYPMAGKPTVDVPNPTFKPSTERVIPTETTPYEKFRLAQEDPNYVPEYDLRRPTTYNENAKVATDLNQYAKGQSKLLQPSGATTDVANVLSRVNNESLLKALPKEKGAEYLSNLKNYSDLSILDRINEIKTAFEAGGSRNSLVNNLANRIYHQFGHQLTATALDSIANVLRTRLPQSFKGLSRRAAISQLVDRVTTKGQR